MSNTPAKSRPSKPQPPPSGTHPGWVVYTDGSFWDEITTFGAVVIHADQVVHEISEAIPFDREGTGARQIIGELWAVRQGLAWLQAQEVKKATVYYDYVGVRDWALELFRPRFDYVFEYLDFLKQCPIQIHWRHVKGHTGNFYNERAHELATEARKRIA